MNRKKPRKNQHNPPGKATAIKALGGRDEAVLEAKAEADDTQHPAAPERKSDRPQKSGFTWVMEILVALATAVNAAVAWYQWDAMDDTLRQAKRSADAVEKALAFTQANERPVLTVAGSTVAFDGLNMTSTMLIKNSGKGITKLEQVSWIFNHDRPSAYPYWSQPGGTTYPDLTFLGSGDSRRISMKFAWPNAERRRIAEAGMRFQVGILYTDGVGNRDMVPLCQHYEASKGTSGADCLNLVP